MTTIAWDGKTLAADTQQTQDGAPSEIRKLWHLTRGGFAAGSGDVENLFLAMEWFNSPDRSIVPKPVIDRKDPIAFLHVYQDVHGTPICDEYGVNLVPVRVRSPVFAIGSGRVAALVAMHLGKDAVEAVQIASKFDIYTSLKCVSVRYDSYTVKVHE